MFVNVWCIMYIWMHAAPYNIIDLSTLDDILQRCLYNCTLEVSSRTFFATLFVGKYAWLYTWNNFWYEPKRSCWGHIYCWSFVWKKITRRLERWLPGEKRLLVETVKASWMQIWGNCFAEVGRNTHTLYIYIYVDWSYHIHCANACKCLI